MTEKAASTGGPSRRTLGRTYYDILGVPIGASIDHIKDSYRLLTRKTLMTDAAFRTLTDPKKRLEYDARMVEGAKSEAQSQVEGIQEGQDWGKRGRERCACGEILKDDDEWLCQECWGKLDYCVVFDMFGGRVIHDSQMPLVADADGQTYYQVPSPSPSAQLFGPFTKEEAEAFLKEKNEMRRKI